jgi:hypothetical protein
MINCSDCEHFDRGYTDDGYQRSGKCRLALPPYVRTVSGQEVDETDGCDLGKERIND